MEKLNPFLRELEDFGTVCYEAFGSFKHGSLDLRTLAEMYSQLGDMLSAYFNMPISFHYPPASHPKLGLLERHLAQYYIGGVGSTRLLLCRKDLNFRDGDTLEMAIALQEEYPFNKLKSLALDMGRRGDAGRIYNSVTLARYEYQFEFDQQELIDSMREARKG